MVAFFIQLTVDLLPTPPLLWEKLLLSIIGVLIVGAGSSLYLTCGLGPGPRDGLMTALHYRSGLPVGRVRLFIEIVVLSLGWALGGRVGVGTFLFALLIGFSVAFWLGIVRRFTPH